MDERPSGGEVGTLVQGLAAPFIILGDLKDFFSLKAGISLLIAYLPAIFTYNVIGGYYWMPIVFSTLCFLIGAVGLLSIRDSIANETDVPSASILVSLGIVFVIVVTILLLWLCVILSGILFSLVQAQVSFVPFKSMSRLEALVFFMNQVGFGALFDVFDVFDIYFSDDFRFNASEYRLFGGFLVVFRLTIASTVIAVPLLLYAAHRKTAARIIAVEVDGRRIHLDRRDAEHAIMTDEKIKEWIDKQRALWRTKFAEEEPQDYQF